MIASVCPALTSTPPSLARSGKTCPGRAISSGLVAGSTTAFIVSALSCTEMPVVTLCLASMDTVKAVQNSEVLLLTIRGISNSSSRSPVMGRQISPLACWAIKLIASGVTFSAAKTRSPSFSLASSSTTMTNLPDLMSLIASSILDNPMLFPLQELVHKLTGYEAMLLQEIKGYTWITALVKLLHIFSNHINLKVDQVAHPPIAQVGVLQCVINYRNFK